MARSGRPFHTDCIDCLRHSGPARGACRTAHEPADSHGNPMDDKDWIAGAAKALAIIEAFDEEHARMTPTAVAGRAGL